MGSFTINGKVYNIPESSVRSTFDEITEKRTDNIKYGKVSHSHKIRQQRGC